MIQRYFKYPLKPTSREIFNFNHFLDKKSLLPTTIDRGTNGKKTTSQSTGNEDRIEYDG